MWSLHLNHLPSPSHFVSRVLHESTASDVLCVSSGELISGCDPTGRCQPSRKMWLATGSLLTVWWRMLCLGQRVPLAFLLWLSPACLSASSTGEEPVGSWLALLWYLLNPFFCEPARLRVRLESFTGKFSLSLSLFFSLSGFPTAWVATSH